MGALDGVRVIELAGIGPGPFCGMMLADMGADVIRVDRSAAVTGGDPEHPPRDILARGRRSIGVDLKHPEGRETVLGLVEGADLCFEGFRPGVAERLGVGPEDCLARNPALVYGRMTGWGQDGPYASAAGHDADILDRPQRATVSQSLDGAGIAIGANDQPRGLGPETPLLGDLLHQLPAPGEVAETGKDARVDLLTKALQLDLGMPFQVTRVPGQTIEAIGERRLGQIDIPEVNLHPEPSIVGNTHDAAPSRLTRRNRLILPLWWFEVSTSATGTSLA